MNGTFLHRAIGPNRGAQERTWPGNAPAALIEEERTLSPVEIVKVLGVFYEYPRPSSDAADWHSQV